MRLILNIVLIEPEIPGNTGNIARLCAVTNSHLHLVKPLGFSIDDKHLKRAGLDYWNLLKISYYDSFQELYSLYCNCNIFYYMSTKADKMYTDIQYKCEDFLVFGKESAGIPKDILSDNWSNAYRIPMINEARSLNLSNAVAIVVYEALRQTGFRKLTSIGAGI